MATHPKILLINPPFERLKGYRIESISLGLLYLASVLHKSGFKANVYDADSTFGRSDLRDDISGRPKTQQEYVESLENMEHPAWQELVKVVLDYKPDIVGVTVMTPVYHSFLKTLSILRKILPGATIIAGGPHVTITGDDMMKYPEIDFAFYGEAEFTLLEFTKRFSNNEDVHDIRGLIYRDGNKTVRNEKSERIKSLDSLPFPNKDLLIFSENYRNKLGAIIASRGCPFKCTFCATVPLWGKLVRFRSAESICEEMAWLYEKYNIKKFEIVDDTFTLKKKAVINLCQNLIERFGEKFFTWVCNTNIQVLDDEQVQYLNKAGCYKINIGIESGSDRILKLIRKSTTTDMVRKAVKMIKKGGLLVHGFFVVGFPQETEEDLQKTIDFIKEIKPDSINLCTFTPFPNTELYDYVVKHGFLDPDDNYEIYKTISTHSDQNYFVKDVDRETYLKYLRTALTLVGDLNKRKNWRKRKLRYRNITLSRIRKKIFREADKMTYGYRLYTR